MKFFDSLTHATADGTWLGGTRYDASLDRLLKEMNRQAYRACLVNIAGYQDNETLADFASKYPDLFVPIAGFDPSEYSDTEQIETEIENLSDRGFAGLKLHPRLNSYDPLDERCIATISLAAKYNLVIFLDTLFRQKSVITPHPADAIDAIAIKCPDTKIVLLHGGGGHLLDIYEIVRMREKLLLDVSFTIMRYAGSSIDLDIGFLCRTLDLRLTVGSDFPEYTPAQAKQQLLKIAPDLPQEKLENICFRNLEKLFQDWQGFNQ